MKVYAVINNTHIGHAEEWIDGIYATKELAIERINALKSQFINDFIEECLDEFSDMSECLAEANEAYDYKPIRYEEHEIQTEKEKTS